VRLGVDLRLKARPLIGRIVGIMNGFEPQERRAISRFLTAVIDAVPIVPAGRDDGPAS